MTNVVKLPNTGPVNSTVGSTYFPRLQFNGRGEIILATSKKGNLTTGILVGLTPESKSELPLGTKFVDWEVCGELQDYSGGVTVTLQNRHR